MDNSTENSQTGNRRNFLKTSMAALWSTALGTPLVFAENIPEGYLPLGLHSDNPLDLPPGKSKELVVLNDRPWNV